jgi:hypothetical protein
VDRPATDEAIRRAGADGRGVLVAPIAFVSEHVETLVELDHEYAVLAKEAGCPVYLRAPPWGVGALHRRPRDAVEAPGAARRAADLRRRPLVRRVLEPVPGEGRGVSYDLLRGLHILAVIAWMAGAALPAAPVRLPRQGDARVRDGHDLRQDGAQAAPHHHEPGHGRAWSSAWR